MKNIFNKKSDGTASKHVSKTRFKLYLTPKTLLIGGGALVVIIAVVLLLVLVKPKTQQTSAGAVSPSPSAAVTATGTNTAPNPSETPSPSATPIPTPPPEYKIGDKGEGVKELQQRLMDLNYLDIDEPTSNFGGSTQYALELFQRQHKLQIDGIFGGQTRAILFSDKAKPYTMMEGAYGADIQAFQKRLKELGFLKKITSYYGSETIKAVEAFQKRNSLTIDGKAGQHTLDLIYSSKALGPVIINNTIGTNISKFISTASKQLGKRYIMGTEGPRTFDCSGLVYYCLTHSGVKTGRLNALGYSGVSKWKRISSMSALRKGDVLFFQTNGKRVGHTGIYIGGGMMIDASSSHGHVIKRSCSGAFWRRHFVVGRRPWK